MTLANRAMLASAPLAAALALVAAPAFSAGGGGAAMPSESGPQCDPVAEYRKGTEASQAKDCKNAAKAFQRVVTVVPGHAPAQYLLASSHIGLGDYRKARKPLELAIKADPILLDAQRDLGVTNAKLGDTARAQAQRDKIAALKTSCAGSCPQARQIDTALADIDAALAGATPQALGPSRPISTLASVDQAYVRAVSLINEGKYQPAIALLQDSLWNAGPHPDLLTYLGFANRKLQNFDVATGWYGAALAVAPDHRGALEYYGELKLERGDRAGALQHLARLGHF
ncbi:MAG: hypothetical protein C0515_11370, partial [Novosphingobium sp.]|nr:hypothetical protein [Novosphingobium sp.]